MVYEWDQTLEEVNMYVEVPPGVTAKVLAVRIDTDEVAIGIRGNPPYLEHRLTERVKTEECYWTLEDGELHLQLQKLRRGKPWESLFEGHAALDPGARAAGKSEVDAGAVPGERTRGSTSPAPRSTAKPRIRPRSWVESDTDDRRRSLGTVETWGRGNVGTRSRGRGRRGVNAAAAGSRS